MKTAAAITHEPARLAALCKLWVAEQREVWLTLRGYSMTPAIEHRSRVLLRCAPEELLPGKVAAYLREGELVIHRAISRDGDQWLFRGDGNDHDDAPVPAAAIIGIITEVTPPSAPVRLACRVKRAASHLLAGAR